MHDCLPKYRVSIPAPLGAKSQGSLVNQKSLHTFLDAHGRALQTENFCKSEKKSMIYTLPTRDTCSSFVILEKWPWTNHIKDSLSPQGPHLLNSDHSKTYVLDSGGRLTLMNVCEGLQCARQFAKHVTCRIPCNLCNQPPEEVGPIIIPMSQMMELFLVPSYRC